MSDELHVVSLVALFDAVHADGVAVRGVTGVTPVENVVPIRHHESDTRQDEFVSRLSERELPVKIVHWVAGVTGNLVQALTSAHSLFNGILIVHDFIIWW